MSSASGPSIAVQLNNVTADLNRIQRLLQSEEELDNEVLKDFRDAVNRVRNTAWVVEQYANSRATGDDPGVVLTLLAGERVRTIYQLCRLLESDLANPDLRFQKGQLLQLRDAAAALTHRLEEMIGQ